MAQAHERENILNLLQAIRDLPAEDSDITPLLRRYSSANGTYAKSQLLDAYQRLVEGGALEPDKRVERRLRGRPVRTISGVAPVAVLTEPYPCPGTCIFCPDQRTAPKSYLDGEPGVLRALQNDYDPYAQTHVRIRSLEALGHATDKVELLILGGTWSAYPQEYRQRFLRRCFDAMNETESATLDEALERNETAIHRNVGLVVETRPDWITPEEVLALRRQGVTKVQVGAQSFDDAILTLNRRGHTVADIRHAMRLLRLGGFKIVLHWMPNLYGATPASDLADFARLWDDPALRPDELKIYPTALLEGTDLYTLWQQGQYTPYSEETLIELLVQCKALVQPYSRINRLMRDIPAHYIVAGTTKSNLRQIVQTQMQQRALACHCIRCREVRGQEIAAEKDATLGTLSLEVLSYATDATQEYFLQYLTSTGQLAAFLRLSLPAAPRDELPLPEIREAALVRELHVYGQAQALGQRGAAAQHHGLGTQLLAAAAETAWKAGFRQLAVIAAVGTRPYYRARGFTTGNLYMLRAL
ncbi:MAG TPA: tRNA uridine(34) 5-carboxymethylaminomethyl modification radical SAM/GNAT enzyme Elp3 [Anaerolineae bacterium]|nr:tRNA uridine(34) 5-carboxymethylaminomethyl modification radical SAM/GNAT enzyme Elp3 [Anaerolineae bacterium]HQH38515.1 tRNA uridine(34) 5-carboxymethylaminomethyl modification radical SAM/GNAT enzyme Elp3 [Anaerolineae bacterium]